MSYVEPAAVKLLPEAKYMMATKAFHKLGELSREEPSLCCVDKETADSYYGNWITGFGFYMVQFPKATTRDLTKAEIEENDGRVLTLNGKDVAGVVNISGKDFNKPVRVTKKGETRVRTGTLLAPIKVGGLICVQYADGRVFRTTTIKRVLSCTSKKTVNRPYKGDGRCIVETRNSTYEVEYGHAE